MNRRSFIGRLAALFALPAVPKLVAEEAEGQFPTWLNEGGEIDENWNEVTNIWDAERKQFVEVTPRWSSDPADVERAKAVETYLNAELWRVRGMIE